MIAHEGVGNSNDGGAAIRSKHQRFLVWKDMVSLKPWIHPQDRRSRIVIMIQIIMGSVVAIALPIMVLQDPTRDHVIIGTVVPIIAIIAVIFLIRAYRKLPEEYRTESDVEPESTSDPASHT
ncbi:hypothetical protein [Arthrobacter burdickii]|uniref:Uncharacterized protein n=1 Tax=Arthrobacter burdickii TaxID=3035920 RepID=A0ABT8JZ13_9MICC|nr:hypothetical protein [Arthrobacter burdickii]MDN4609602.1 hypothetical protein [Arthrobacter burdickii]